VLVVLAVPLHRGGGILGELGEAQLEQRLGDVEQAIAPGRMDQAQLADDKVLALGGF